ncbi:MAG: BACON domain-containing protein [Clostridium sp.]|nr:BACON domain-containing protein [Bacteroides sp.]MCM1197996.1 BACON domain-containing protein [Clostridium sp.]
MKKFYTYILVLAAAFSLPSCSKVETETELPVFQNTTIADFNAQAADDNWYYYLTGTIAEIKDAENSHFILKDNTGEVLVYGLWKNIHGKRIRNMGDYSTGDKITVAALKGKFANEPYAKDAYVVDAGTEKMWVTPSNAEISSEGDTFELMVFTDASYTVSVSDTWIKAGEADGNKVTVTVDANESIFPRYGYVNVRSSDMTIRVKVSQAESVPEVKSISSAAMSDYAHVEGTVVAIAEDGYMLADATGAIFVSTDKFGGIYIGATLSVTGPVSTSGYMTRLTPELTKAIQAGTTSLPEPRVLDTKDIDAVIASASSNAPDKAGSLKCEYVRITGTLVFIDGKTRLVSDGNIINAEPYKAGSELDFDALNGHTLDMYGYVVAMEDGMLKIVLVSYEDIPVESMITIDGDYSDWESLEDLTAGNDLSASHNLKPVVKLHCENGYVYGYIRVDKSEENGGYDKTISNYLLKIAGRFYVWIDNDGISEGQGGGWLFNPQRYDNVIAYRITRTAGGWDGWSTVAPRANEYYGKCVVGNKHTDDETNNDNLGYMATTVNGDILEGEFSFLAAKAGLFGKEKTIIGLEIGWDNGFNTGSASLGKKGYEITLK